MIRGGKVGDLFSALKTKVTELRAKHIILICAEHLITYITSINKIIHYFNEYSCVRTIMWDRDLLKIRKRTSGINKQNKKRACTYSFAHMYDGMHGSSSLTNKWFHCLFTISGEWYQFTTWWRWANHWYWCWHAVKSNTSRELIRHNSQLNFIEQSTWKHYLSTLIDHHNRFIH